MDQPKNDYIDFYASLEGPLGDGCAPALKQTLVAARGKTSLECLTGVKCADVGCVPGDMEALPTSSHSASETVKQALTTLLHGHGRPPDASALQPDVGRQA